MDRPYHDLLGDRLGRVRLYPVDFKNDRRFERSGFLYPSAVARRLRGGLLSRHHILSNTVVPGSVSRTGRQLFHAGDSDFVHYRIPDFRNAAESDRLGAGRLAMAIHSRSAAVDPG